ncbi:CTP synthase [Candidatus Micrarchaeota archaeon]|nr:CTP synthase [Candidatus Micrarchaeota archaeon]MBU1930866.1 CTP synthase [Candidatus Micrarchaeota archaeon]
MPYNFFFRGFFLHRARLNSNGTKYIAVTGGVISGLGKGVVTASIGRLLKSHGFSVTAIKIDPYLNFDAGTMRPTEHGEVFVTFDGGETDQDLGTYERFLGETISRSHNITTGQVFGKVIENERNMHYKGVCVEVIPHIPEETQRRIEEVAQKTKADFVLIEMGGTIGDYQNMLFIEALKKMFLENHPILFVHVVYLPVPSNVGEMKTKPAQHSVRALNELGIFPDFIVCRSKQPIDDVRKQKISTFCNVKADEIISAPDLETIYKEPLVLAEQEVGNKIMQKLGLTNHAKPQLEEWKKFVEKIEQAPKTVKIGIVGKYFDIGDFALEDSYISVIEAIKFAAWKHNAKPKIKWIDSKQFEKNPEKLKELQELDGIIVPGGFGSGGVEGKIKTIQYCRENNIPFLGLCYGLQLAVIEFARNVLNWKDANSAEVDENTTHPVIDIMEEQKALLEKNQYGNTMRLGNYDAELKEGTKVWELYGKQNKVVERHRHRFEVNPKFEAELEKGGMVFSGRNPQRQLVEFIELSDHPFFVATQAHPEFTSRPLSPNPLFDGFIASALKQQK